MMILNRQLSVDGKQEPDYHVLIGLGLRGYFVPEFCIGICLTAKWTAAVSKVS